MIRCSSRAPLPPASPHHAFRQAWSSMPQKMNGVTQLHLAMGTLEGYADCGGNDCSTYEKQFGWGRAK